MDKITVVIVDDNQKTVNLIEKIISQDKEIEVVGIAFNGLEALSVIKKKNPDVIILDLIMPKLDGIGVLEKVQKSEKYINLSNFIILSGAVQEHIVEIAFRLGAKYCIIKPPTSREVITKIKQVKGRIPIKFERKNKEYYFKEAYIASDLELKITDIIHKMGIPAHVNGYFYLRDAIIISIADKELLNSITKLLYPIIAKIHNTTSVKVESSIRHAITIAWSNRDETVFNNFFYCVITDKKKKPTNTEFIALIVDKFQVD